jgi:hypothetical protein
MSLDGTRRVFSSPGGQTLRFWPDGRSAEDYTKAAPPSATVKGVRWALAFRGVQTSHVETRSGRLYSSEIANPKAPKLTRIGKVRPSEPGVNTSYNLPCICSETRLPTPHTHGVTHANPAAVSRTTSEP